MNRVASYQLTDASHIRLTERQLAEVGQDSPVEVIDRFAQLGSAFTLRDADGQVLMIAGLLRVAQGFAVAWAFMDKASGKHMRWLTRMVRRFLDSAMQRHRRIEMTARCDFEPAMRWAELLGFDSEGVMQAAAQDGSDMMRFARINREWRPAP